MIIYLIAIIVITLLILISGISSGDFEAAESIFVSIAILFLIGFLPSIIHTKETIVVPLQQNKYVVKEINPYKSVFILMDDCEDIDGKAITDSYMLMKIKKKKFRVLKHIHHSIWGWESNSPTYYIQGLK